MDYIRKILGITTVRMQEKEKMKIEELYRKQILIEIEKQKELQQIIDESNNQNSQRIVKACKSQRSISFRQVQDDPTIRRLI